MPNAVLIGLLSETPVHIGVGQAAEAIDLPIAREATTRFPHIPGSGTKGGLRVWGKETAELKVKELFGYLPEGGDNGQNGAAGTLLFGEARLALLPIRSTSQGIRWATSPLIINRLIRDLKRVGTDTSKFNNIVICEESYLGAGENGTYLGLEEREFANKGAFPDELVGLFNSLAPALDLANQAERLIILNDTDLSWFAQYGLPIAMRNSLDENKQVIDGALWAEESMASDTVLSMIVAERKHEDKNQPLDEFKQALIKAPHVQFGGNETIGQGWFGMSLFGDGS